MNVLLIRYPQDISVNLPGFNENSKPRMDLESDSGIYFEVDRDWYEESIKKLNDPNIKVVTIEIKEALSTSVSVWAKDDDEGLAIVKKMYEDEKIILDYSDMVDVEFNIED